MEHDELGFLKKSSTTASRGGTLTYVTNALGQITSQTEIRQTPGVSSPPLVSTFDYDEQGRLRKATDPLNSGSTPAESNAAATV